MINGRGWGTVNGVVVVWTSSEAISEPFLGNLTASDSEQHSLFIYSVVVSCWHSGSTSTCGYRRSLKRGVWADLRENCYRPPHKYDMIRQTTPPFGYTHIVPASRVRLLLSRSYCCCKMQAVCSSNSSSSNSERWIPDNSTSCLDISSTERYPARTY